MTNDIKSSPFFKLREKLNKKILDLQWKISDPRNNVGMYLRHTEAYINALDYVLNEMDEIIEEEIERLSKNVK